MESSSPSRVRLASAGRRKQQSAATARVRRDDRLGRSAVTFRSVVKAHIHRPPSCEILRQPLHVATAAEVAEYRWRMRLSGKIVGVESSDGDDEARWVVAIGPPQEA
jgi:hypothetical protein